MEILAISDIYGDVYKLLNQLSDQLEGRDRLSLIAGDIDFCKTWINNAKKYRTRAVKILKKVRSFSRYVFYAPGDTDSEDLNIEDEKVVNVDKNLKILNKEIKVGVLGLGGAPNHSLQSSEFFPYTWNEMESFVREELRKKLRINFKKIQLQNPDFTILLSHSPPYGIADKSIPISPRQLLEQEELLEINPNEDKSRSNPKHLGSRTLRKFIGKYKIDFHFFGHVHKRGGLHSKVGGTNAFNISHFSVSPHKLYGRKFLRMKVSEEEINWNFRSVVKSRLDFETYLGKYL